MKRAALALAPLLVGLGGCGPMVVAPELPDDLPPLLSQTRLTEGGGIVDAARPFTPRWPLWTDGHVKERHVLLPEGEALEADEGGAFDFPLGTRFAKTVFVFGERVETRVAYKLETGWELGAYRWEGDEAVLVEHDVDVGGYEVPGRQTCLTCHSGHPSPLGYRPWQLGDGQPPGGDAVQEGLGYVATHCGSCHRDGGYAGWTGLHMNLPSPLPLSVQATPVYRTAVLVGWIVPGDPDGSLVFARFTDEGPARMPPIGTRVMHGDGVATLRALIEALPPSRRRAAE